MNISEKQIFALLEIAQRFSAMCFDMGWEKNYIKTSALIGEINNQQSTEQREIK